MNDINLEMLKSDAKKKYENSEYEESIRIYNIILLKNSDYKIFSNRSLCNYKIGKYEEALNDAKECVKLNSKWSKGWGRLGTALYYLKKYNESLIAFNKALELENNNIFIENIKIIEELKNKNVIQEMINPKIINKIKNLDLNNIKVISESLLKDDLIKESLNNEKIQGKLRESLKKKDLLEILNDKEVNELLMKSMKIVLNNINNF